MYIFLYLPQTNMNFTLQLFEYNKQHHWRSICFSSFVYDNFNLRHFNPYCSSSLLFNNLAQDQRNKRLVSLISSYPFGQIQKYEYTVHATYIYSNCFSDYCSENYVGKICLETQHKMFLFFLFFPFFQQISCDILNKQKILISLRVCLL